MSTAVDIIIILFSIFSLTTAGLMVWYVRKVLMKMAVMIEKNKELSEEVSDFVEHLETVYGLDTFYGDETLRGLLDHTKSLAESLADIDSTILFEEETEDEEYESD